MRQSKRKWLMILIAVVVSLTGCGSIMPETTDEQMNVIGEYAAVQLLKYAANSRSRLVDAETIEMEEKRQTAWENAKRKEPISTPEPEGMRAVDDTPVVELGEQGTGGVASLEEYYGLTQGLSMTYSSYQICDSYSPEGEDGFLNLSAANGKKLLVLSFQIENTTDSEQAVDLFAKNGIYRVTVNGSYTRNALITTLLNDITTYISTLSAHSSGELVMVVEIEQTIADNITSIAINLKNEGKSYTIQAL